MVSVDFVRFVLVFGVAFAVLFSVFLMVFLALASGGKKRSVFVKSFIFFGIIFLAILLYAYYNPETIVGWIK